MKILKSYQKVYLIFAIILWIIICFFYLMKLILLLYIQITKKYFNIYKLEIKVKWILGIIYYCSYLLILIGFIYDIILLLKGEISSAVYPIIYFVISFIYCILSVIDFYFIEDTIKLICKVPKINSSSVMRDKPVEKESETEEINDENKKKND